MWRIVFAELPDELFKKDESQRTHWEKISGIEYSSLYKYNNQDFQELADSCRFSANSRQHIYLL